MLGLKMLSTRGRRSPRRISTTFLLSAKKVASRFLSLVQFQQLAREIKLSADCWASTHGFSLLPEPTASTSLTILICSGILICSVYAHLCMIKTGFTQADRDHTLCLTYAMQGTLPRVCPTVPPRSLTLYKKSQKAFSPRPLLKPCSLHCLT